MKKLLFISALLVGAITAHGRSLPQKVDVDGADLGRKDRATLMQTNDDTITAFAATVAGWTNKPKIGQVVTIDADGTPAHWMLYVNDGDVASDWREVAIADSSDNFNLGSATISALVQNRTSAQVESLYTGAGGQSNQFDLATDTGTIYRGTGASTYEKWLPEYSETAWYVSKDSANASDTTAEQGNPRKPYATINAAMQAAATGDTIIIRKGTYSETNVLSSVTAGTYVLVLEPGVFFSSASDIFDTTAWGASIGSLRIFAQDQLSNGANTGALVKTGSTGTHKIHIYAAQFCQGFLTVANANSKVKVVTPLWDAKKPTTVSAGALSFINTNLYVEDPANRTVLSGGTLSRVGGVWWNKGTEDGGNVDAQGGVYWMYGTCVDYANDFFLNTYPGQGVIETTGTSDVRIVGHYVSPANAASVAFTVYGTNTVAGSGFAAATNDPLNWLFND